MKPSKLRDNLGKTNNFELSSSPQVLTRHALPPLHADLAEPLTLLNGVGTDDTPKSWSGETGKHLTPVSVTPKPMATGGDDSNIISTISGGLENKDFSNKESGGIGVASGEKKRTKRQPKPLTQKEPLNESKPADISGKTTLVSQEGGTHADLISPSPSTFVTAETSQRRIQRLTSSSPARQLASLQTPTGADIEVTNNLDPLLRTPTTKRIDLASIEDDGNRESKSSATTVGPAMLRPQRSSSVDMLGIVPLDGIASSSSTGTGGAIAAVAAGASSKSRLKPGGASLTSLDAYQQTNSQQQLPPPIFAASDAFGTFATASSNTSISAIASATASFANFGIGYNDSQCTNIDDIIRSDNTSSAKSEHAADDSVGLGFNIIIKDESKASMNDRILQSRIQEAKALNRNNIDVDNGAVMHKFSLWSKASAANSIPMGARSLQSQPPIQPNNSLLMSPTAAAAGDSSVPSTGNSTVDKKGTKLRGPKAVRANLLNSTEQATPAAATDISTSAEANANPFRGKAQTNVLPAPLPNIFDQDGLVSSNADIKGSGNTSAIGAAVGISHNESLMGYFDIRDSNSQWSEPTRDSKSAAVAVQDSLAVKDAVGTTAAAAGAAGLAKSLRSKVGKAAQHAVSGGDSPVGKGRQQAIGGGGLKLGASAGARQAKSGGSLRANIKATRKAELQQQERVSPLIRREKSESSLEAEAAQQQQYYDDDNFDDYVEDEGAQEEMEILDVEEMEEDGDDIDTTSVHSIEEDEEDLPLTEVSQSGSSIMMATFPMHPAVQRTRSSGGGADGATATAEVDWGTDHLPTANVLIESPPKPPTAEASVEKEINKHSKQQSSAASRRSGAGGGAASPYVHQAAPSASRHGGSTNKKASSSAASLIGPNSSVNTTPKSRRLTRQDSGSGVVRDDGSGQAVKPNRTAAAAGGATQQGGGAIKGSASTSKKSKISAFKQAKSAAAAGSGGGSAEESFPDERLIVASATAPAAMDGGGGGTLSSSPVLSEVSDVEESGEHQFNNRKSSSSKATTMTRRRSKSNASSNGGGGASIAPMTNESSAGAGVFSTSASLGKSTASAALDFDRAAHSSSNFSLQSGIQLSAVPSSSSGNGIHSWQQQQGGGGGGSAVGHDEVPAPAKQQPASSENNAAAMMSTTIGFNTTINESALANTNPEPIKWKRGEVIGEGAFGKVYKGLNERTGELLAVKQLFLNDGSDKEVNNLRREIKLICELHHENIVRYLGTTQSDRYLFILLEYVPGGSIAKMLEQFGAFSEDLLRRFCCQIMAGMEYLHDRDIIHRDIKGANVLVTDAGVAKLSDFGCSRQLVGCCTASLEESLRGIRGSVPWMAPEVIKQSGETGKPSDIWSIGAFVIEMASGKPPYSEFNNNLAALFHVATSPNPPPIPSHLSAQCAAFIGRCCVINPEGRATARQLRMDPFIQQQSLGQSQQLQHQSQQEPLKIVASSTSSKGMSRSNSLTDGSITPTPNPTPTPAASQTPIQSTPPAHTSSLSQTPTQTSTPVSFAGAGVNMSSPAIGINSSPLVRISKKSINNTNAASTSSASTSSSAAGISSGGIAGQLPAVQQSINRINSIESTIIGGASTGSGAGSGSGSGSGNMEQRKPSSQVRGKFASIPTISKDCVTVDADNDNN